MILLRLKAELRVVSEAFTERKFDADGKAALDNSVLQKIYDFTVKNVWYLFMNKLLRDNITRGINWIDFESEIRNVIFSADRIQEDMTASYKEFMQDFTDRKYYENISLNDYQIIVIFANYLRSLPLATVNDFRKYIYMELERLIAAMELYFAHFINGISCDKLDVISTIKPEFVVTFNYTDTFERLYTDDKYTTQIIYIHGKSEEAAHNNNMVLGINEYWSTQDEIKSHVNYAIFRKYVQRIRKRTSDEYYRLMQNLSWYEQHKIMFSIHVFGHSLDITDKYILSDFFLFRIFQQDNHNSSTFLYSFEIYQE